MAGLYRCKFYKGDYEQRERAANADKAVCYVEHHFNGGSERANHSLVIVARNASGTSKSWAMGYAKRCADAFGTTLAGGNGVVIGGYDGRGNENIDDTAMPAILVEPLFGSNPRHAAIIKSETGQRQLAGILAASIKEFFPGGGLVAFSVGHKYKTSKPNDRGVGLHGGGNEADEAEKVLMACQRLLEA